MTRLTHWLLDDLRDCPELHPYREIAPDTARPTPFAARVELLRLEAMAWLWGRV